MTGSIENQDKLDIHQDEDLVTRPVISVGIPPAPRESHLLGKGRG